MKVIYLLPLRLPSFACRQRTYTPDGAAAITLWEPAWYDHLTSPAALTDGNVAQFARGLADDVQFGPPMAVSCQKLDKSLNSLSSRNKIN